MFCNLSRVMIVIMKGIFNIYKSKGPTSHNVIFKLRQITGIKKIGHAGTLDPLASGVLVVGIGREATKKLGQIVEKEKEYLAEIKLGEVSITYDREGPISKANRPIRPVPFVHLKKSLASFVGKIKQMPPQFSAVKIKGKPAYKYARAGRRVKIKPRKVEIKSIKILKYKWPILKIKVVSGPGVYIRSLAHDLGQKLKCGGYLLNLKRTRVGNFKKEDALTIEKFKNFWQDKNNAGVV